VPSTTGNDSPEAASIQRSRTAGARATAKSARNPMICLPELDPVATEDAEGAAEHFASFARALLDGPRAWARPEDLAVALGWEPAEVDRIATGLEAAGLVDRWNECWTLSPLGASRLGVTLVADDVLELYRWSVSSVSARTRRPSHRQIRRTELHDYYLRQRPDPRTLRPDIAASRAERVTRRRWSRRDEVPKPSIILWGKGLLPWEEVRRRQRPELRCRSCRTGRRRHHKLILPALCDCGLGHRPRPNLEYCPGCHGKPLRPSMYCLRCDRWGMDGYFASHRVRRPIYWRHPAAGKRRLARAG
jgi:hypothetical protein